MAHTTKSPLGKAQHFTEFLATPPETFESKFPLSIIVLIGENVSPLDLIVEAFSVFASEELEKISEELLLDQRGSSDSEILTKK